MISNYVKNMYRKKIPILITSGFLLLFTYIGYRDSLQTNDFSKACLSYMQQVLPENTLNLHYTLAYPEKWGITADQVLLPPYRLSAETPDPDLTITGLAPTVSPETDAAAVFRTLTPETLSVKEQYLLSLFQERSAKESALEEYPYYDNLLSPHSGQQVTLLTLLSEYQFYEKKDIEDYLTLLTLVPDYLDSLSAYTAEKIELGLSPGSDILRESALASDDFFSMEDLLMEKNFLQENFHQHLKDSADILQISSEEMKTYTRRHNQICKEILLPAYEKLAKELNQLAENTSPVQGLAAFPKGQAYYRALFAHRTGSRMTVPTAKEALTKELTVAMLSCRNLLKDHPLFLEPDFIQNTLEAFPLKTSEEMLDALQKRMALDFPALPEQTGANLEINLEEVSPSLRSSSAPAFYLLPPTDFCDRNVIYTNPQDSYSSYKLYTTLAHEGFPGHLYQTVYSYAMQDSVPEAAFRSLLNYVGYQEGYALYCEFLSYDYAGEYYHAKELSDMEAYVSYEKENHNLQLCLLTLLEIMIHDENADFTTISNYLSVFGITNEEQLRHIYRYIAAEPCCYSKYYISYLEIKQLQEEARLLWADTYSDLSFHTFLLDYGPADFDTLHRLLKNE